jgi:SAM-dependent methyltransferase
MGKDNINQIVTNGNSIFFWQQMILKAAKLDFREPMPEISDRFVEIWSRHYTKIGCMTNIQFPALEIGSGYGVLGPGLGLLTQQKIIATEHPSRGYLLNPSYHKHLEIHNVELVLCDLLKGLPFENEQFKLIYFCDVIEHINPIKIPLILQEINRVLMNDGKLVMSTPNLNRLSGLFRFFAGYSVNPPIEVRQLGETFEHIRELAPKELLSLLTKTGFITEKMEFITNPYFTASAFGIENIFSDKKIRFINLLTSILVKVIPRIGDEMYLVAKKKS